MRIFFKKYASYLISTLFLLLLVFTLKNLQKKELKATFSVNFLERYKDAPTLEIAGFDEGENWKGNFTRDSGRSFDGETGMNIFTQGKPNIITLQKSLNLTAFGTVFVYINIDSEEMLRKIDSLAVGFKTDDGNRAESTASPLKRGWNLLPLPKNNFRQNKFDWARIVETSVALTPKKGETAQITLDRIWTQQPIRDRTDFLSYSHEFLNLKTVGKKTFLHLGSPFLTQTIFNKSVNNRDFSYTVSFAPKKFGSFGLSFQTNEKSDEGYFFVIEGAQMNAWRLYKKEGGNEVAISHGSLTSSIFEKEAYLWLRVEKKGNSLTPAYSINNQRYIPFKTIEDSSFSRGYVGIFSQGSFLVNSVEVKE